ncbi:MAG: hypothetical protein IPM16_13485 [Chloroflexi bacterium]|nr:hypothetical protein [Chloroflexota bacterium]
MRENQPLEAAILRTVLYADIFDYALSVRELHHFLIHPTAVELAAVEHALVTSPVLAEALAHCDGWITLADRTAIARLRIEREHTARDLWPQAERFGKALARLPFVRMVGLTGALAMRNPSGPHDDLDYLIVTRPGRVWLARLLSVAVVRWVRLRGREICPNFVLAEDRLAQTRRDLYIAHEVSQVVPLFGRELYDRLRDANCWTLDHLPNALHPLHPGDTARLGRAERAVKSVVERVLSGRLGDWLEGWERRRKMARFAAAAKSAESAAVIDDSQVKGHFNDHGSRVLMQYRRRLERFGLAATPDESLAAD